MITGRLNLRDSKPTHELVSAIRRDARPLRSARDLGPLIDSLRGARVVMLGEASHGTSEFYEWRARISRELIERHGFSFIAVEGDWPPCHEVNRFVTNKGRREGDARGALEHFHRWPTWMWANTETLGLVDWLERHNATKKTSVGFHGLDVYSLFESIDETLQVLEGVNPFLARRARAHYACFDPFHRDERRYARSLNEFPEGCESQVIQVLQEALEARLRAGRGQQEDLFDAVQNARIVRNAENYYRTMIHGNEDSWNVRDRHMMETLGYLMNHYGPDAKGIVWEHNTHIGDYRATDMASAGQINIGGLARQAFGEEAVRLVGFGTYQGTVIASHSWDGPTQSLRVPPGKPGSIEAAFHEAALALEQPDYYVVLGENTRSGPYSDVRGHRAIGVVYDPEHERWGNYVPTDLSRRYDAFVFLDRTRALDPLPVGFVHEEIPETWPRGQ